MIRSAIFFYCNLVVVRYFNVEPSCTNPVNDCQTDITIYRATVLRWLENCTHSVEKYTCCYRVTIFGGGNKWSVHWELWYLNNICIVRFLSMFLLHKTHEKNSSHLLWPPGYNCETAKSSTTALEHGKDPVPRLEKILTSDPVTVSVTFKEMGSDVVWTVEPVSVSVHVNNVYRACL